jgi:hypothetical protein
LWNADAQTQGRLSFLIPEIHAVDLQMSRFEPIRLFGVARVRKFHGFRRAHHTHAGAHWLKMMGLATPLVIGEFVKDYEKRWKWTRVAILLTAMAEEGF